DGSRTKGRIDANSKSEAYDRLQQQALVPVDIFEANAPVKRSFWQQDISLSRRVSANARAAIARELGLLLKAGIALDRCLHLLLQKTTNRRINAIMARVRERVVAGASFPAALAEE